LAATVVAALALSESGTTQVAFLGALAAVALARWRPGLAVRALPVGLIAAVLAMPWLAEGLAATGLKSASWVPFSLQHRIFIWQHVAEWVFQKPAFGWGFAASEHLPGFDTAAFKGKQAAIPLHPHNAALQLWLELGLVGVVAGCGLLSLLFRRLMHDARPTRDLLLGAAITTVLIALPGYGLWQTHWVGAIVWTWFAAAVVLADPRTARAPA
jgi:O-antigen ligase